MAGEWLKFESNLPEKPETMAITAAMGWDDTDLTVGKLMRLFRWFDQQTVDGNAVGVTTALLDKHIGVPGFVQAVINVRWLEVTEGGLALRNFDRHNGETAKSRALTAKRVAKHRSNAQGNAVDNAYRNAAAVTSPLAREEKRREEDSVSKDTGGKPPKMTDPKEIIFGYGLSLLVSAGVSEKQARSFLGGLDKAHGSEKLIDKLRECAKAKPLQPLEWLAAALPPLKKNERNADKCPAWCKASGFVNVYEAGNAGCYEHTAAQFRDGKKLEAA
jgi:hypothetical protein